jgi:hypothetical protein
LIRVLPKQFVPVTVFGPRPFGERSAFNFGSSVRVVLNPYRDTPSSNGDDILDASQNGKR